MQKVPGRSFRASLMAIVAAAFTIEALYGAVEKFSSGLELARKKNWVRIKMVLSDQFDLSAVDRFDQALGSLCRLRDEAAHAWDRLEESVPHPTRSANVSAQVARYTADEATRSVDLAIEILYACVGHPRDGNPHSGQWAEDHRDGVQRLIVLRTALAH